MKEVQPNLPGKKILDKFKAKEAKRKEKEKAMKKSNKFNPLTWVSHDAWVVIKTIAVLLIISGLVSLGWFARGGYEASVNSQVDTKLEAALTVAKQSKQ